MALTITTQSIVASSNYMLLQCNDPDVALVINKIEPPADAYEGYPLLLEFDRANKGGGIFIKNKTAGEPTANMRLNCWQIALTSYLPTGFAINATTLLNKNVMGHVLDVLTKMIAADNAARDVAMTAANAAYVAGSGSILTLINTGAFAYGLGGIDFSGGFAGQTKAGTLYFDYSNRPPFVILFWDGTEWHQGAPLSNNAIS